MPGPNIDKEKLKERFKIRVESQESRNYIAFNESSAALGRYQYLPSQHGKFIVDSALKKGIAVPDSLIKNPNSKDKKAWQWFLNNPTFQDQIFDEKFDTWIYPDLLKIVNNPNSKINSLDETALIIHHRGTAGAEKWFTEGKTIKEHDKGNKDINKYISDSEKALMGKGMSPYKINETISYPEKMKVAKQYINELQQIQKGSGDNTYKEEMVLQLQQKYKKDATVINEVINDNFSEEGLSLGKAKLDVYSDVKQWQIENNLTGKDLKTKSVYDTKVPDDLKKRWKDAFGVEMIYKDSETGKYTESISIVENGGQYSVNGKSTYFLGINDIGENIYGLNEKNQRYNFVKEFNDETFFTKNDPRKAGNWFERKLQENINKGVEKGYAKGGDGSDPNDKTGILKRNESVKNWMESNFNPNNTIAFLPEEEAVDEIVVDDVVDDKKGSGSGYGSGSGNGNKSDNFRDDTPPQKTPEELKKETNKNIIDDLASIYGNTSMSENQTVLPGYDKGKFKKDIPFEALAGLGVAMAGIKKSETKIPLHDEIIDQGFLNWMADLKKMSEIGLPPEVEAAQKQKLSDAYKLGMENIVRVSAGNRNLVLGNQSQLDASKMQALTEMSVADYEAKIKAFEMYGEAMRYVNEFQNNKEFANTQLKQQIAISERAKGDEMANAGFAHIIASLEDAKNNAPGSFKHMAESAYLNDIFGFIPGMKGDGPGTKAYLEKKLEERKVFETERLNIARNLSLMTDQQKEMYGDAVLKATNFHSDPKDLNKSLTGLLNFAANNNEKIDTNLIGEALKNDNWSLLTKNVGNISLTDAQLNSNDAGGSDYPIAYNIHEMVSKGNNITMDEYFKLDNEKRSEMERNYRKNNNLHIGMTPPEDDKVLEDYDKIMYYPK